MKERIMNHFGGADAELRDIARHIYEIEYQPHDIYYAMRGAFHVFLMSDAGRIRSAVGLWEFIESLSIKFVSDHDHPFTFDITRYINHGLLVPERVNTKILAFDRDLHNKYPGFPEPQTYEWRQTYRIMCALSDREWSPADFLDPDLRKLGMEFGIGVWTSAIRSYEKYSRPEMNRDLYQQAQRFLAYYGSLIGRIT